MYRYGEGLCGGPRCCAWQNLCPWDPAWSAASMDTGISGYGEMTSPGDRRRPAAARSVAGAADQCGAISAKYASGRVPMWRAIRRLPL